MFKGVLYLRAAQRFACVVAIVLSMFSVTQSALAQANASLSGVVRDPSGALVAGAALRLTNLATGSTRAAESSSVGAYSFPQVSPGTYSLSVTGQGYKSVLIPDMELRVSFASVVDINFESPSAVQQTVDVVDESPVLNTADASNGNPFDTRQVLQLPLEARNVAGLLSLQTGVTFLGSTEVQDARNGSVDGGRSDQANVTLDGVDVNDQDVRPAFTSVLRLPLDSVQEFRVTTIGANADEGRSSGAQISLVTKGGSNVFHGSLYEFNRNTAFTANSYLNNLAGVPRPQLIRNVFGGSLGGPVKKDRLFFFFNYEGRRDDSAAAVVRTVPTDDLRNGILDYVNETGGVTKIGPDEIKILDPQGIGENSAVLALFNQYPHANDTTTGDGLAASGYRFTAKAPLSWNTYVGRLDWQVDQAGAHTVFVRGNLQNDNEGGTPQFPGDAPNSATLANAKGIAVGYTHVLRPNLVGTAHYGLTRISTAMSGVFSAPVVNPFQYFLDTLSGTTTGSSDITPVQTISEDVNWTRSNHVIQFGGVARVIRRELSDQQPFPTAGGSAYQLQGGQASLTPPDAPSGAASAPNGVMALLGVLSSGSATYNYQVSGKFIPQSQPTKRDFGNEEYELYLQDGWHIKPNLTVIGGLRWSLMPPPSELNGQQTTNIPSYNVLYAQRLADAENGVSNINERVSFVARNSPQGRPLYSTFKKNFAPRVSIAYSPDSARTGGPGKTTIRFGAGIFYDLFGSGLIDSLNTNAYGLTTNQITPNGAFSASTAPRFSGANAIPSNLIPPAPPGGPGTPPDGLVTYTQVIDRSLKPPYVMNFNLAITQDLGRNFGFDIGYVGRFSRRQLVRSQGASQPLNFRDPVSGMRLYDAMGALDRASRAKTPASEIQPIAFWEDLYSHAKTDGLSATQVVYSQFAASPDDPVTALVQLDSSCDPACSDLGPYTFMQPQFYALFGLQSFGTASYNSLQATFRKRFSRGYQFDLNYTFSKSMDIYSQNETRLGFGFPTAVLNALDPKAQRAVSDFDFRHQFNANWVAELPVGEGRRFLSHGGPINAVVGGWQLSGLFRATSGLPLTALDGYHYPTNWCCEVAATQIAPVYGKTNVTHSTTGGPNLFADPTAAVTSFDFTQTGGVGNRNTLRGEGVFSVDMGLGKRFALPFEHQSVQFRAEAFNLTNTARFTVTNEGNLFIDNPNEFGTFDTLLGDPRVLQLGLRYEF